MLLSLPRIPSLSTRSSLIIMAIITRKFSGKILGVSMRILRTVLRSVAYCRRTWIISLIFVVAMAVSLMNICHVPSVLLCLIIPNLISSRPGKNLVTNFILSRVTFIRHHFLMVNFPLCSWCAPLITSKISSKFFVNLTAFLNRVV